ncbi:MAG: low molecular weight protein-tyrosine-phosphatase [Nocardioidaceae bacterium]
MLTPLLPAPRAAGDRYRVAVVCTGNICRSPMADVVLTDRLARAGLADAVEVASSGTGECHVGHPMDRRAAATLTASGYDASRHRAQQFDAGWFDECDLVLAMDRGNHADLAELASPEQLARLRMFRDFDPLAREDDREVPDPYYGGDGGFDTVLAMVERTADSLVAALAALVVPEEAG